MPDCFTSHRVSGGKCATCEKWAAELHFDGLRLQCVRCCKVCSPPPPSETDRESFSAVEKQQQEGLFE